MIIVKLHDLAAILGITARQINKLARLNIIPRARRGEYELSGAVQAYISFIRDGDPDKNDAIKREELRVKKAQADKLEMDLALKKKFLIHINDYVRLIESTAAAIKGVLVGIPKQAARERDEKDLEPYLETFINRCLNDLTNLNEHIASAIEFGNREGLNSIQTGAQTHRIPMGGSGKNHKPRNQRRKR